MNICVLKAENKIYVFKGIKCAHVHTWENERGIRTRKQRGQSLV